MADFFKGLTGGFQSGLQMGQQLRQRQLEDSLTQEAGKYNVTEGAYGPGLQENIQQLEGLKAQDPAQAAAYDQAIGELTRRQGLAAPDYSVASGPTNFATRQEARQAAAPMRAEGLAGVYRQYGDVAKADELEARAFEQQRAIAKEGREVEQFGLTTKEAKLRIGEAERTATANKRQDDFSAFAAERPDMSVADLKNAAFKDFKFSPEQWQKTVTTRLGIENAEMDSFKNNIKKKLQGKNLTQLGSLYNTDSDFDDKTDLAIVPGKGGAVTLNFVDKATGRVSGSQSFKNEALATEYLNKQATEPETIGSWMMNLRKTEAAIGASEASAAKDKALGGRYSRDDEEKGLSKKVKDVEASLGRKLTEPEKLTLFGLTSKPRDEKPVKVEDAGVQYKVDGKLVQTDGMGGFISAKGILPGDRPAALKTAGVADNNLGRLIWSNDGEAVMFGNEEYDVRNKRDMAKLNKAIEDSDVMNRRIAEEARLRANPTSPSGFQGARTTGLGPASTYGVAPGAQSIYGR